MGGCGGLGQEPGTKQGKRTAWSRWELMGWTKVEARREEKWADSGEI